MERGDRRFEHERRHVGRRHLDGRWEIQLLARARGVLYRTALPTAFTPYQAPPNSSAPMYDVSPGMLAGA